MFRMLNRVTGSLFKPVDIASLVYYRIAFGLIMFYEMATTYFSPKIKYYWIKPDFLFKYYGFEWVKVPPGDWLYHIVLIMMILAAFITLGLLYRISMTLFFIGFSYLFLLEQALYLNHYYLVILISFIMIFLPANKRLSVDSRLKPSILTDFIPAWCLWILIFQISVIYFYASIAKMNMDWLQGEPVRMWIAQSKNLPLIGTLLTKEITVYTVAYFGILFDLLIVPLMLWEKTRKYAFLFALLFHGTNKILFDIGIFPVFALCTTALYFSPDWPRRLLSLDKPDSSNVTTEPTPAGKSLVIALLSIYVAFQVLFPLRHFLYPGNVSWTEEGHNFAWHMKLRDKRGYVVFEVRHPESGREWKIKPHTVLNPRQYRKMSTRPQMLLQFAHYIAEQYDKKGYENVEVRARALVSLNGRDKQLLVDPSVDLTTIRQTMTHSDWILPLKEPLKESY